MAPMHTTGTERKWVPVTPPRKMIPVTPPPAPRVWVPIEKPRNPITNAFALFSIEEYKAGRINYTEFHRQMDEINAGTRV